MPRKRGGQLENVRGGFRLKLFLNVRFFGFSENSANMQKPVVKRVIFVQQEVANENLKVFRCSVETVFQIVIICPDKRVSEIPCILGENLVCHVKTERPEVFDKKYRRRRAMLEGPPPPFPLLILNRHPLRYNLSPDKR